MLLLSVSVPPWWTKMLRKKHHGGTENTEKATNFFTLPPVRARLLAGAIMRYAFAPFLVLAIAFIALGISSQRAFLYIGIAFLILALVMLWKRR